MSVDYAPSVATVVSRGSNKAWVVRSLLGSLWRNVRGVRGRVPISAGAFPLARAWTFGNWRGAGGGNRYPTDHRPGYFELCGSARPAPPWSRLSHQASPPAAGPDIVMLPHFRGRWG